MCDFFLQKFIKVEHWDSQRDSEGPAHSTLCQSYLRSRFSHSFRWVKTKYVRLMEVTARVNFVESTSVCLVLEVFYFESHLHKVMHEDFNWRAFETLLFCARTTWLSKCELLLNAIIKLIGSTDWIIINFNLLQLLPFGQFTFIAFMWFPWPSHYNLALIRSNQWKH